MPIEGKYLLIYYFYNYYSMHIIKLCIIIVVLWTPWARCLTESLRQTRARLFTLKYFSITDLCHKHFSFSEFLKFVSEGYVLAMGLKHLGMEDLFNLYYA